MPIDLKNRRKTPGVEAEAGNGHSLGNTLMATPQSSEAALQESEARLRAIVETAVDAIITIDEKGIIGTFNPAAERIFGYTAEEAIGQNVKLLMPPHYREAHDSYLAHYLKTGAKKIIGIGREVVGQRKDGSTFPMHLAVSEVQLGRRRLFTGIVRDLTEQKKMEKQILQTERLATIGKMAAKVAHEIRNPLSSISLNAELLQDEVGSYDGVNTDEAGNLLKAIIMEIDRVTSLTEEYLQFSRLPESQPVRGNIDKVVEETIEFLRYELRQKHIEIECHVQNPFLEVHFDRVQIRRALLNLIRNAVEAMPQGGRLKIWTDKGERAANIHIEDTGIGIPPEAIEKIFDPFFTTKELGTGLGLAIVDQIITEHGGQITCSSHVGLGTIFSIMLPLDKIE